MPLIRVRYAIIPPLRTPRNKQIASYEKRRRTKVLQALNKGEMRRLLGFSKYAATLFPVMQLQVKFHVRVHVGSTFYDIAVVIKRNRIAACHNF